MYALNDKKRDIELTGFEQLRNMIEKSMQWRIEKSGFSYPELGL